MRCTSPTSWLSFLGAFSWAPQGKLALDYAVTTIAALLTLNQRVQRHCVRVGGHA